MTGTLAPRGAELRSLRDPLLVGVVGLGAAALLHFRDPHDATYILCPFLFLTGIPCPGCGGLRAISLMTQGDILGAVSANAFAVLLLGVLAVAWVRWVWRRGRGVDQARMIVLSGTMVAVMTAVIVLFGIVRATPWGSWLAP